MATVLLTAAASSAAASFGTGLAATLAASALTTAATIGGRMIDNWLFGSSTKLPALEGPRLSDLAVQTSTYGRMIPIIYGNVRVAGNIIWSRPIKETANTTTVSSGGKGGGGVSQSQTSYSYSISLAIALCEGPIDDIVRVWADAKLLDPTNAGSVAFRLYKGTEDQMPDPFIESFEGVGKTPAYRGMTYVVIEDFPLADYGNRIPNFTFEIKRNVMADDINGEPLEHVVSAMMMIPGSGEFVYDTVVQNKIGGEDVGGDFVQVGTQRRINQNNRGNKSDALVSLNQLERTCPNVEWVGVVVTWFGDSMDAGDCVILPGVEYDTGATTAPDAWSVAGFDRDSARLITQDENGNPVYGGTVNDASLVRYLTELQNRGYKVMCVPMFFMDVEMKPWRGRVTGTPSEVSDFFTKTNGYNAFVTHYADLVKDHVDAFVIGSELIGLTKVQDIDNSFPAVDALVNLASTVRGIMGPGVKLTYAADWSEYHHTDGGWYNLDPLWASDDIDFIGIDAYFPLTNEPESSITKQKIIDGWTSGEGYSFYYSDEERTIQAPLAPPYAWKNIAWWWENNHVNPDSSTTAWVPESKKIWFTEYGFPSVDGASNQPNVFYDPNSSESYFPRFSQGRIDFRAQRRALAATEEKWLDSEMIENKFIWTWDARPFPFWPDLLNVWTDGGLWKTGHWVQGKFGLSNLGAIVRDLCLRAGLTDGDIDVSRLTELVDGFILTDRTSARRAIEALQRGFFFDAVESDNVLKFIPRGGLNVASIDEDELVPEGEEEVKERLMINRVQELELPQKVDVLYINRTSDYQTGNQHSQRLVTESEEVVTVGLPIVMGDQQAKNVADISLFNAWMERTRYSFSLPPRYARLEPTDVITVGNHPMRVIDTQFGTNGVLRVQAVAEDVSVYDFYNQPGETTPATDTLITPGATQLALLDIAALPSDNADTPMLYCATTGVEAGWNGAVIYRAADGVNYSQVAYVPTAAVIGTALDTLGSAEPAVSDEAGTFMLAITGEGELESVSYEALLNGANAALLGDEIIQFREAVLVASGKYQLRGLLRGRLGTEDAIGAHSAGERFVLLNGLTGMAMSSSLIGLPRDYKPVTVGSTLGQTTAQSFTYQGNAFKPFSPVHIKGARDGSNNLTISWTRRTRTSGEWRDYVDVPLGEAVEAYEIEILNGVNVVRTLSATSPQVTYTAAQQTTDFGSAQPSVSVRMYQVSAIVGRGKAGVGVV